MSDYLPLTVLAEVVGEEVDALPWLARRARLLPPTRDEVEKIFSHWQGIRAYLDTLRERFESGDSEALLDAIRDAADLNIPLPQWAATAYCSALDSYEQADPDTRTLADAFGIRRPKSENLEVANRKYLYLGFIQDRYKALKHAGLKTALNADGAPTVWEQISDELKDPSLLKSPDNPSPDELLFAAFQIFPNKPETLTPRQIQDMFYER
jgi:hypothetical protein